jgi:hypothetical protein
VIDISAWFSVDIADCGITTLSLIDANGYLITNLNKTSAQVNLSLQQLILETNIVPKGTSIFTLKAETGTLKQASGTLLVVSCGDEVVSTYTDIGSIFFTKNNSNTFLIASDISNLFTISIPSCNLTSIKILDTSGKQYNGTELQIVNNVKLVLQPQGNMHAKFKIEATTVSNQTGH